jgi:hypothetical protein
MSHRSTLRQQATSGREAVERTADLSEQVLGQITERTVETVRGFMRSIDGALPRHGAPRRRPRGSGRRVA